MTFRIVLISSITWWASLLIHVFVGWMLGDNKTNEPMLFHIATVQSILITYYFCFWSEKK